MRARCADGPGRPGDAADAGPGGRPPRGGDAGSPRPSRPAAGDVVVVDMGGTHIRFGHVSAGVPAERQAVRATDELRSSEPVPYLASAIEAYGSGAGIVPRAVVMGVPVSLDAAFDTALSSPNIPSLEGVPLGTELARALGLPVLLERDITLLLLGEWLAGAGRGAASLLGMFVGTGVGGSFLLDGRPYRGASGGAVEIGHIPLRAEGRRCVCGNLDCLEAYASGHRLRALQEAYGVPYGSLFVVPGPAALAGAREEIVRDLGYAAATAINLFDPEVLVVGGGVPSMNGFPRSAFERTVRAHLRRPVPAGHVRLEWTSLGSRAALYGALRVLELRGAGA